jgi:hypothetical protein
MAEPVQPPTVSTPPTLFDKAMLAGALALPWTLIRYGIDVTDQGYLLTIYRNFLRHPESVGQAAHMWLTNVLGGLWDAAFGELGVIAHRAQWATCVSLGMLIAFVAVRRVTSFGAAALAVLATAVFVVDRRETWFSYNSLTALINTAVVATMARGLAADDRRLLFVSGALLGLSPFARFPNVLALSLLLGPLVAVLLLPSRRQRCLGDTASAACGALAGAAAAVSVIFVSGRLPLYRASLASLFAPAVDRTGHGSAALLELFLSDQSSALAAGLATSAVLAALHLVSLGWPSLLRTAGFAVASVACVLMMAFVGPGRDPEHWRYFVVGTCYIALLGVASGLLGRSFELRCLALLSAGALLITPLGSDQGMKNSHWGLWVALPLLVAALMNARPQLSRLRRLADVGALVVTVVCAEGALRMMTYTYRDSPRARLEHSVKNTPQLRWLLTTEERAKSLEEVVAALTARVRPGDYLLTSESTPLLQYLTRARPYLGIPWIMVDEDPAEIDALLTTAPQQRGCLPVLVRARGNARSAMWPRDVKRGVDRSHEPARRVIGRFVRKRNYRVTWSNAFFEILEPPPAATSGCR